MTTEATTEEQLGVLDKHYRISGAVCRRTGFWLCCKCWHAGYNPSSACFL
jgi:hypothetical protein